MHALSPGAPQAVAISAAAGAAAAAAAVPGADFSPAVSLSGPAAALSPDRTVAETPRLRRHNSSAHAAASLAAAESFIESMQHRFESVGFQDLRRQASAGEFTDKALEGNTEEEKSSSQGDAAHSSPGAAAAAAGVSAPQTQALVPSRFNPPQTHLRDIVAWSQLSHQYSLGYGLVSDGAALEPVAVYDKSFVKPDFELSRGNIKETLAMGFHTRETIHDISMSKRTKKANTLMDLMKMVFEIRRKKKHHHRRHSTAEQSSAAAAAATTAASLEVPSATSSRRHSHSNILEGSHVPSHPPAPKETPREKAEQEYKARARIETIILPDGFFDDPANGIIFRQQTATPQGQHSHPQPQQPLQQSISFAAQQTLPVEPSGLSMSTLHCPRPSRLPVSSNNDNSVNSFLLDIRSASPGRPSVSMQSSSAIGSSAIPSPSRRRSPVRLVTPSASSAVVSSSVSSHEASPSVATAATAAATPPVPAGARRALVHFTSIDWSQMLAKVPELRQLLLSCLRAEELDDLLSSDWPSTSPDQMSSSEKERYSPLKLYLHSLVFRRVKKHTDPSALAAANPTSAVPASPISSASSPLSPSHSSAFVYKLHLNRSRPVKVIDLRFPESSFFVATARASLTNILKGGIGVIPFYGPPQVVVAATERVFDYSDVLALQKQAEAMELVLEALRGNPRSPFTHPDLTKQRLMDSMFYLLRSNIMLGNIIKNGLTQNDLLAQKYIDGLNAKSALSLQYLQQRSGNERLRVFVIPHTHFAFGVRRDPRSGAFTKFKLYVLCFTKIGRARKPHAALDFMKINREKNKRQALQYLLVASNMIYLPVPAVGSIVKLAYKESVIREIHRRQMWEHSVLSHIRHNRGEMAALLAHNLEIDLAVGRKYEALAIRILEERAFSPLDLTTSEADERRQQIELWQARLYKPLQEWRAGQKPPGQMGRVSVLENLGDDAPSASPDLDSSSSQSGSRSSSGSGSTNSSRSAVADASGADEMFVGPTFHAAPESPWAVTIEPVASRAAGASASGQQLP